MIFRRLIKKTLLQVWSLCVFLNFTYSSKYFGQIYRAQYGAAWRPQNNVIIFNLLWLSNRLIVCIEETGIYIRTFPNTLTSKMAKYQEIRICFFWQTLWNLLRFSIICELWSSKPNWKIRFFPAVNQNYGDSQRTNLIPKGFDSQGNKTALREN